MTNKFLQSSTADQARETLVVHFILSGFLDMPGVSPFWLTSKLPSHQLLCACTHLHIIVASRYSHFVIKSFPQFQSLVGLVFCIGLNEISGNCKPTPEFCTVSSKPLYSTCPNWNEELEEYENLSEFFTLNQMKKRL